VTVGRRSFHLLAGLVCAGVCLAANSAATARDFDFHRDTFTFANATVFKYYEGIAFLRASTERDRDLYTRRCFVMTRAALQFCKFARFDPGGAALSDAELGRRVRTVMRRAPWHAPLPEKERTVFAGYANLREMSEARPAVLKKNIGQGWPTYIRLGNFRMFYQRGVSYQEQTHTRLNAMLAGGDLFVAYLTTYPRLSINHAVLIYKRKRLPASADDHYLVYDPNHAEAPRELIWSASQRSFVYQKDVDFIGGAVRVYQVYGKWLQ